VLKFNPAQCFAWLSGQKGGPHAPDVGVAKVVECDPMYLQDALTPGSYVNHMSSEEGIGNYAYLGPCVAVAQNLNPAGVKSRDVGTRVYSEDRGNYAHFGAEEALAHSGIYGANGALTDLGVEVLARMGVRPHTTWLDLYDAAGLWLPLWNRYIEPALPMGAATRRPARGLWKQTLRWNARIDAKRCDGHTSAQAMNAALGVIARISAHIDGIPDEEEKETAQEWLHQYDIATCDAYDVEPGLATRRAILDEMGLVAGDIEGAAVTLVAIVTILKVALTEAQKRRATAYSGRDFVANSPACFDALLRRVIESPRTMIDTVRRECDLPPPFNFLLLRPYATYRMGTAMLATSGGRAGHTFVGKCDLSFVHQRSCG
jgi:hypothetical protein